MLDDVAGAFPMDRRAGLVSAIFCTPKCDGRIMRQDKSKRHGGAHVNCNMNHNVNRNMNVNRVGYHGDVFRGA